MKFSLKFTWPKFTWPKLRLPKLSLAKIAVPRLAPKSRSLVIGASALALLGAGALAWFFVRPMLGAHEAPAREAAADKAAEAAKVGEKGEANSEPSKQGEKKEAKPEAAPPPAEGAAQKAEAEPEKAVESHEKPEATGKAADSASPPETSDEPERLIRRLQDIQERVAGGDAAAFAEMPRLLRLIARKFEAQPPDVWTRRQNARALILYLLSGGGSAIGRKILGRHSFAASEERLAKGAIAYLENVDGADRDFLLSMEPRSMELDLGAQIAFVQSILLTRVDRPRAIAQLDLARLLAPGGLVEEAALRREVALLSETKEFDKFAILARQYWTRYRASPYADNFLRQFMVAVARVSLSIKVSEWAQLTEFIDSLTPETRRSLYLGMAQTAAVAGNFGLAAMAAQFVLDSSPAETLDSQRALLYRAAAKIGLGDRTRGLDLAAEIDRAKLPSGDQPLYDAVALAEARIFHAPERKIAAAPPGAANEVDAAMERAEGSLKQSDAVMDSVRQTMERKSR
jgi:chemotaxis protein MotC